MKTQRGLIAAVAMACSSVGAAASGCAGHGSASERLGTASAAVTIGSICAAPSAGGEYCVASDQDLNVAWSQAVAAGGLPVQVWARWPSGITLNQFVSDAGKMNAWLVDVDRVISFVRDVKKSAESYRATMSGNLGTLLKQAKDEQARLLKMSGVDPFGKLRKSLTDKALALNGPVQAKLATDKQIIAEVHAVFEDAKEDLAPLQAKYAALTTRFVAYRATEAPEATRFEMLANQASLGTLETLPDAELAIFGAARDASAEPNELVLDAMRLQAQIQQLEIRYRAALAPYAEFISTHGTLAPDMTSGALRSLEGMQVYVARRGARNDATASSLLDGTEIRRQALVTLATSDATRATLAQTRLLAASTTFNDEANARVAALWKLPAASTRLKLPYLSDRYDQFAAFLQMEPLCDATSATWRETGCVALRRNFTTARSYQTNTIPLLIKMGLATMRTKGVDPLLLDAAQAKLTAGDVKAAALAYDTAVRTSEQT